MVHLGRVHADVTHLLSLTHDLDIDGVAVHDTDETRRKQPTALSPHGDDEGNESAPSFADYEPGEAAGASPPRT
jgi:hypothetical protein